MPGVPVLTAFTGQTPPWSLTSLDANFTNQSALLKDVGNYNPYVIDGGAADAYVVTFGAGITYTLASKPMVVMKAANANTTASTLNANATGVKNILNPDGSALAAGQITSGGVYVLVYDGTQYILIGGSSATTSGAVTLTLTGCATAPTFVGAIVRAGKGRALSFPGTSSVAAVSSAATKTFTGIGAGDRPSGTITFGLQIGGDNGTPVIVYMQLDSSGVVSLGNLGTGAIGVSAAGAGGWTGAGNFTFTLPSISWVVP